jgi:hypothetical protein
MTEIAYRCNLKQRVSQGHYKCDNKDRQQRKGQVRDHPQNRERRVGPQIRLLQVIKNLPSERIKMMTESQGGGIPNPPNSASV